MSSAKMFQKNIAKSKIICKYFILGKCIKGEKCPYLHSQIDKPKDMTEIECPMYSIGYCKNGPVCHFIHIKKEKFPEYENEEKEKEKKIKENNKNKKDDKKEESGIDEEEVTSSTPLAEDFIDETESENNKKKIEKDKKINNKSEENLTIEDNNSEMNEKINKKDNNDKDINFKEIPIWYLEHYYDKPILMIFSELENQNLPEVIALQKKYGFKGVDTNLSSNQTILKKNNLNMNTLNLNFNNFNMNFDFNNQPMSNFPITNQLYPDFNYNQNFNFNSNPNNYNIDKDMIEYIINKDINIYYYLIKIKKYKKVVESYNSNTIKLPEQLFNKYKNIDLYKYDLTIIIIIYNKEYDNFVGFAKLLYPIIEYIDEDEDENEEKEKNKNLYKIEWLWKNKTEYSEVSHLMNRADDDHFLNEGKNGCPIDKDLGNYLCRLMIKRLTREEIIELMNEKQIFNNQIQISQNIQNLKRYKYDYIYDDYFYDDYGYDNYYYNNYNDKFYYEDRNLSKDRYRNYFVDTKENNNNNKYNYMKNINKNNEPNIIDEVRNKKRKRHKNKSKSKSHIYSDNENRRYHKRKQSNENLKCFKHKKTKENIKKIYSQINEEYNIHLK